MPFHQIEDPERLHALIDAIMLIEVEDDLDDLLSAIVDAATELIGARYGAIGIVGSDRRTLARFITRGIDDTTRSRMGPDPHGAGVLGETMRRATALRVDHLPAHAGFAGFPKNHPPMDSFLGVPVITGDGHIYGNLYLCDRSDGRPFDDQDERLIEAFGRAAGLVIDQAVIRDKLSELTLAEERERLASDLHDTVIQRLFGIGLALQVALADDLPDSARDRVDECVDELDRTIRDIRTTIFEIDADDESRGGLTERIGRLCEEVRGRLGLEVGLDCDEGLDAGVSSRCANQLAMATREALSNVARHASARRADVEVRIAGDRVTLSVRDDGVGFSERIGPGSGLRNLTTRARQLGGDCLVESEPGRGTLVRWSARRQA
ncbi:MAG TPA: GAF domain-containing sensor histidine kinase [Acidimicrobiales bacterium]|nr:GAF domain-containing sensor histidine kinase [Acidimicrobiales bacterium]